MNINVQYPPFMPNSLQPATESARRDGMRQELITQPRQVEPYAAEKPLSDAEKSKAAQTPASSPANSTPAQSPNQAKQGEVHAHSHRVEERRPQDQEQDNSQQDRQQGENKQGRSASRADQQAEQQELKAVRELSSRDREVRAHEQAHASVGGKYAGAPRFDYERGPDGRSYAVGGEVRIDLSSAGEPAATIRKMRQVRRAALAPIDPSPQDRRVAAEATAKINRAFAELAKAEKEEVGPADARNRRTRLTGEDDREQQQQAGATSRQPTLAQEQHGVLADPVDLNRFDPAARFEMPQIRPGVLLAGAVVEQRYALSALPAARQSISVQA